MFETFNIDFKKDDDFADVADFASMEFITKSVAAIFVATICLLLPEAMAFAEISLSVSKSSMLAPLPAALLLERIFNSSAPAPKLGDFTTVLVAVTEGVFRFMTLEL